ncbi:MAG: HAD-IB family hydrolase [Candidatus Dormibacteria bacterium]
MSSTNIRDALAGRTLLLTGATGFLGSGVLEKLLRSVPEVGRVMVLLRGNPKYTGEERLRRRLMGAAVFERLRSSMGMGLAELAIAKLEVLEGDLGREDLGLSPESRLRLAEVEVLLHTAATVVFDAPLDQALRTNLEGPRRLVGELLAAGARPRVVHVSTAYTCGARRGLVPEALPGSLPEGPSFDWRAEVAELHRSCDAVESTSREPDRLDAFRAAAARAIGPAGGPAVAAETERLRHEWVRKEMVRRGIARARALGWNDVYNFTKALAERAVADAARDLELAIVRPSIIESAWREPEPGWLDGFKVAEPIILGYARGEIPDFPGRPEGVLDIVPVDCVVNAALAACATPLERGRARVFHVTSGARNPLRYGALYAIVRDYFLANPLTGRDGWPVRVPDWRFAGRERLESRLRLAGRALRVARGVTRVLPAGGGKRVRTQVRRLDKVITQARYYADLYGDYVEMETVFDDRNTQALFASLSREEQLEFPFDLTPMDWKTYFDDAHLPAVVAAINRVSAARKLQVAKPLMPARAAARAPGGAAAFFDVDGTILHTNVVVYYLWLELRQRGIAEWPEFMARLAPDAWRWRQLDRRSRAAFNREFYRVYQGLDAELVRALSRETLDAVSLPRMFPKAVQAIRAHRRAGTRVVLLTGALDFLVEHLAPLADEIICARLAEYEGRFTGALAETPIAGEARSAHMREWARQNEIELSGCWAYADSISDLPMLAAVGHPVAVNPDEALQHEAERRGWAVAKWDLPYGAGVKIPVAT